jgi:hypothetical protein
MTPPPGTSSFCGLTAARVLRGESPDRAHINTPRLARHLGSARTHVSAHTQSADPPRGILLDMPDSLLLLGEAENPHEGVLTRDTTLPPRNGVNLRHEHHSKTRHSPRQSPKRSPPRASTSGQSKRPESPVITLTKSDLKAIHEMAKRHGVAEKTPPGSKAPSRKSSPEPYVESPPKSTETMDTTTAAGTSQDPPKEETVFLSSDIRERWKATSAARRKNALRQSLQKISEEGPSSEQHKRDPPRRVHTSPKRARSRSRSPTPRLRSWADEMDEEDRRQARASRASSVTSVSQEISSRMQRAGLTSPAGHSGALPPQPTSCGGWGAHT